MGSADLQRKGAQNFLFGYADESGDSGYIGSPTDAFVLSLVLVQEQDWLRCLDRLVDMRRYLRDPRDFVWRMAVERLDNFSGQKGEYVHVLPDAGHGYFIRRMIRRCVDAVLAFADVEAPPKN